jgi:hypothetical protein
VRGFLVTEEMLFYQVVTATYVEVISSSPCGVGLWDSWNMRLYREMITHVGTWLFEEGMNAHWFESHGIVVDGVNVMK